MAVSSEPTAAHQGGGIRSFVPGWTVVSTYQRRWLPKDVVAGLVLSALLIPQGMAYAELAGLPPITGLYTSILCLLGYAVFGPSRVLVLGPDSRSGPMIAATVRRCWWRAGIRPRRSRWRRCWRFGRRDHGRRRIGQVRFRCGLAVQTDADRLHERPGRHDNGRPAAEAVRVLGRRQRIDRASSRRSFAGWPMTQTPRRRQ